MMTGIESTVEGLDSVANSIQEAFNQQNSFNKILSVVLPRSFLKEREGKAAGGPW